MKKTSFGKKFLRFIAQIIPALPFVIIVTGVIAVAVLAEDRHSKAPYPAPVPKLNMKWDEDNLIVWWNASPQREGVMIEGYELTVSYNEGVRDGNVDQIAYWNSWNKFYTAPGKVKWNDDRTVFLHDLPTEGYLCVKVTTVAKFGIQSFPVSHCIEKGRLIPTCWPFC